MEALSHLRIVGIGNTAANYGARLCQLRCNGSPQRTIRRSSRIVRRKVDQLARAGVIGAGMMEERLVKRKKHAAG